MNGITYFRNLSKGNGVLIKIVWNPKMILEIQGKIIAKFEEPLEKQDVACSADP